jgi:hypothetical protein
MTVLLAKRKRSHGSDAIDPSGSRVQQESSPQPLSKRLRTLHPNDRISALSDELLLRILDHLPIQTLAVLRRTSRRLGRLAGDEHVWKGRFWERWVRPRKMRIPRPLGTDPTRAMGGRERIWWRGEGVQLGMQGRGGDQGADWMGRYKLRDRWWRGVCAVRSVGVGDESHAGANEGEGRSDEEEDRVEGDRENVGVLARLVEGWVVLADEMGLRARSIKGDGHGDTVSLDGIPTSLAVEQDLSDSHVGICVGFADGGWGLWDMNTGTGNMAQKYRHPGGSGKSVTAVAYAWPYILSMAEGQLLSLWNLTPPGIPDSDLESADATISNPQHGEHAPATLRPHLLASLRSHTAWPPLSLSIRTTPSVIIASIAYAFPTYTVGWSVGLQELHLSRRTGDVTTSRLASAVDAGFHSLASTSNPTLPRPGAREKRTERPTSLSYAHPYLLAGHEDNTLTLYLVTSTRDKVTVDAGLKLWGHTSGISGACVGGRGKAVSVSARGGELRVWDLEGGRGRSVRVRPENVSEDEQVERGRDVGAVGEFARDWVGFDDEVVLVLREETARSLEIYDFA